MTVTGARGDDRSMGDLRLGYSALALVLVACSSEVDHQSGPAVTIPPAPTSLATRPQDEAIQNVTEIAAAAKVAFERRGSLCLPAITTNGSPGPAGYDRGTLFDSGDEESGWKCLGWKPSQPHLQYWYTYTAGMGMAVDNPANSSVSGFEAFATGDLDGDNHASIFALTGERNLTTGELTISSAGVYVEDEEE